MTRLVRTNIGRRVAGKTERGGLLAGCLIALAVVAVLVVAAGIFVALNIKGWVSGGVQTLVQDVVDKSEIPQAEKDEIMQVVSDFTSDFESGEVSWEEWAKVVEQLAQSPVLAGILVGSMNKEYIADSELTDEAKVEGEKNLSRFVQGVFEGKIDQTKIDDVTKPIHAAIDDPNKFSVHGGNINLELKMPENVTTEELQGFLDNAKAEADAAGMPDEKYEIDWSAELQLAIDKALGRAPEDATSDSGDSGDGAGETGEGQTGDQEGEDQPEG